MTGGCPAISTGTRPRKEKLGENGKTEWNAMADVGIRGHWGFVRIGQVPDMATETFSRTDPFEQNAIVSSFTNNNYLHTVFLPNSVRYDSPVFSDTQFGVTYSLGSHGRGDTEAARFARMYGNDGFAFNVLYDNGQLNLLANYDRLADSNNSFLWNAGIVYKSGPWKFTLGYEQSTFKSMEGFMVRGNQKEWLTSVRYVTGPHVWTTTLNRGELHGSPHDGHADKLAVGYGYNFSRRTQLYANVVCIGSSNDTIGSVYNSNRAARDFMTGVQFGITHLF